ADDVEAEDDRGHSEDGPPLSRVESISDPLSARDRRCPCGDGTHHSLLKRYGTPATPELRTYPCCNTVSILERAPPTEKVFCDGSYKPFGDVTAADARRRSEE